MQKKKPNKWILAHIQAVHQREKYTFAEKHTHLNMFNCSNKATGQREEGRGEKISLCCCSFLYIYLWLHFTHISFVCLSVHLHTALSKARVWIKTKSGVKEAESIRRRTPMPQTCLFILIQTHFYTSARSHGSSRCESRGGSLKGVKNR